MLKIEYEIKLNELGRPCIELSEDYIDKPEDKFFAIELARYFLQSSHSRMTSPPFDQNTIETTDISIRLLGQIGDEMAEILWNEMKARGDLKMMLDSTYHIMVNNLSDRDGLGDNIIYENKIYKKQNGLKVFVSEEIKIYELNDNNWIEI
jgi:hypothetical protein